MIDIRTAGAKGLGVFATNLIPRGTRIFSERPLLTIPARDAGALYNLYPAVKMLSVQDREALMALSSFRNRELDFMRWSLALVYTAGAAVSTVLGALGALPGKTAFALPANTSKRNSISDHVKAMSIFRSNSFDIGSRLGVALFPNVARINHSCLPNAQGNFHEGLEKFNVHATRDIKADEEVSLNYLPEEGQLRHVRMEKLRRGYGFECVCPACDMSGAEGKEGEEKRLAVAEMVKAFVERPSTGDLRDKEAEIETIISYISLYESQGIAGRELANLYMAASHLYLDLRNSKEALNCAELALGLEKDCLGSDHAEYQKSVENVNATRVLIDASR